jgi:protein TonB
MRRATHALAACRAHLAAAHRRLGRVGGTALAQTHGITADLVRRRLAAAGGGAIASERGGAALARLLARQGSPSFPAALAASVLLHTCLLAALLVLQTSRPHPFDAPSVAVNLVAEDPAARVGARAGIAWDSAASQAAMAVLLTARRDAALMSELVVDLVRRPRATARSTAADPPHHRPPAPPHAVLAAATATPPSAAPVNLPVVAAAFPDAGFPDVPPSLAVPPASNAPVPATPPAPADVSAALPTPSQTAAAAARAEPPPAPPAARAAAARQPAATSPPPPAPPAPTAPTQVATATDPAIDQRYFDAVLQRLQRFKDYPGLAHHHTSGKVEVAFRVARDGTVLTAEVHRSSGYSFLDKAGIDLIYRASPLPALPASLPGESWPIVVPISFRYD